MNGVVQPVISNQTTVHDKLIEVLERNQRSCYQRPIAQHTKDAFDTCMKWLALESAENIIIDACCGVGESTALLAKSYPYHHVIGLDKSEARLAKHPAYESSNKNYQVIRADLEDFIRLFRGNNLMAEHIFLLYPNPYPKKSQLKNRWYAMPVFQDLIASTEHIEIRSNWLIYLQDCQETFDFYGIDAEISSVTGASITPFERKYRNAGQQCWSLTASYGSTAAGFD